ncbi:MAG TPA: hypothetical protein VIA63_09820 [Candidatus Limnocylindria bacterium]
MLVGVVGGARVRDAWTLPALALLLVATGAMVIAAVVLRRQLGRIEIRTSPAGIEYEAAAVFIRSTWENCERIGIVPIGLGHGEGVVLREGGLVRARFPDIVRAQRLDHVIPLSSVMWWWRETELATDMSRWAPQLGVKPPSAARE